MSKWKWNFVDHPERPALEPMEVNYWRTIFNKLLKVGAELEFNLSTTKGICKSTSLGCGCKKLTTHSCWTECALPATFCEQNRQVEICENAKDDCVASNCATCASFKFKCLKTSCTRYVPACATCDSFELNCDNCSLFYNPIKDPEGIRDHLSGKFEVTNCYGTINSSGVHSIKKDGSLLGDKGAEVITIGRRVDFWEFYKMFDNIIREVTNKGGYVNERCSVHMHVLTSYYENSVESKNSAGVPDKINELEKPIPEIILVNFHQLIRKYQNAITWLAMGLNDKDHLTRWEKYRMSVLEISPMCASMAEVADLVYKNSGGMKYGFVDYRFCGFTRRSEAKKCHIEIRALDAIICPSALAAFACLYQALLIKAVEISRWGTLELDKESYDTARVMKKYILNGTGGWDSNRLSNTSSLYNNEERKEYFINEAMDLIQQLKHILLVTGPSYEVLEKIARKPIAFHREEGKSWESIEEGLKPIMRNEKSEVAEYVERFINLREIKKCESLQEWIISAADLLKKENVGNTGPEDLTNEVSSIINNKYIEGEAIWSESLGTILARS